MQQDKLDLIRYYDSMIEILNDLKKTFYDTFKNQLIKAIDHRSVFCMSTAYRMNTANMWKLISDHDNKQMELDLLILESEKLKDKIT